MKIENRGLNSIFKDTEDRQVLRLSHPKEEDSAQKSPSQIPKNSRH